MGPKDPSKGRSVFRCYKSLGGQWSSTKQLRNESLDSDREESQTKKKRRRWFSNNQSQLVISRRKYQIGLVDSYLTLNSNVAKLMVVHKYNSSEKSCRCPSEPNLLLLLLSFCSTNQVENSSLYELWTMIVQVSSSFEEIWMAQS